MPTDSRDRQSGDKQAVDAKGLRSPKTVLWRGLLGGATAGGLLGALVVLPDALRAQFAGEPDTAYAVSWSVLLFAVPIGALVGVVAAFLAVVVWEWQIPRGARRARVAGSATAAFAVAATPWVLSLLNSSPDHAPWTIAGVVLLVIAALISFAIAYLSVPAITTTQSREPTA